MSHSVTATVAATAELVSTVEALMSTIQLLVSTTKVLVSVITSVPLLLPPSLITDTESTSDGNCLLHPTLPYSTAWTSLLPMPRQSASYPSSIT